nr:hypothetical protein BgiMline_019952 [Biomphalaria glabrata]
MFAMHRTAVILTIYLISVSAERANAKESISCSPTLEGSELIVNATWVNTVDMSIKHNEAIVLVCRAKKNCTPIYKFPFKLAIPVDIMDSISSVTLKVETATREGSQPTGGKWSLYYFGKGEIVNTNCLVVAMSDIQCESNTTTSGLGINCFASQVFPPALCEISVNNFRETQIVSQDQIIYTHHNTSSEPVYYNSSCSYVIPGQDVTASAITVDVYMYPNFIGQESAQKFRKHSKILFDLAKESISCSPTLEGSELIVNATWDNTVDMSIKHNDVIVFICIAKQNCLSIYKFPLKLANPVDIMDIISSLTLKVETATREGSQPTGGKWSLHYFGKGEIVNTNCLVVAISDIQCESNTTTSGLGINCFASQVFPPALCEISVNNFRETQIVSQDQIIYTHHNTSSEPVYYNSSCSYVIPGQDVTASAITVDVYMYPNFIGQESAQKFRKHSAIIFDLG